MKDHRQNPFPGLRPFGEEEDYLFFGREDQTLELVSLLRKHRFLAVVGSSGSGKSSLVRAGLLPALHGGTMAQAGSSWEVVVMKPGGSPIENLAKALIEADFYDPEDEESQLRLEATLSRSRHGLVEAVKQSDADPSANTLVVVDQFEEIFRFRQRGITSQEAAGAFIDLLLQAANEDEQRIFVALTMRSDYLGDCAQIPGLAEAVNDGEYLIPRLGRQQRRDAIEKPVHVGGAAIAERLVQRLLNDVGDDADQLPVLQHALMRTWDVWEEDHDPDAPIDLKHYEKAGGMASALSLHADSVFENLPDEGHRRVARRLFKTLTERTADNREIRRPRKFAELVAIAGASAEVVLAVIDAYRSPGVTFLMPTSDVPVSDETVIDISHESLMRVWERLRKWVDEEAQSARIYQRLQETAHLWSEGKAGLYHDPDLSIAQAWHEQNHPTPAWAELYGGGFEQASTFLEQSHQEAVQEEQRKEEARQRELAQAKALADSQARTARLLKRFAATILVALVVAVGLTIWAIRAADRAERASQRAETEAEAARLARDTAEVAEALAVEQQGKTALALSRSDESQQKYFFSRLMASRAIGFSGFGRVAQGEEFQKDHPILLSAGTPEWNAATSLGIGSNRSTPTWVGPQLFQHEAQVSALAIHPSGSVAASSAESAPLPGSGAQRAPEIHVWDLQSGDLLRKLPGHRNGPEALAFHPDGSVLVSSPDDGESELIFWDTETWTELSRIEMEIFGVHTMAWSRDGRFLAGGDEEGKLFLVEFEDLRKEDYTVREVGSNTGLGDEARGNPRITGLVFSPSGDRLLVSRRDATIEIVNPADLMADPHHILDVFEDSTENISQSQVQSIDTTPDGRWLAAAVASKGVFLWELGDGEPQRKKVLLENHPAGDSLWMTRVRFSPDGARLAVAWADSRWEPGYWNNNPRHAPTISVFDVTQLPEVALVQEHVMHTNFIGTLAFVPNLKTHTLISGDNDGLIRVIEADLDPAEQNLPAGHAAPLTLVRFSPDGRLVASADGLGEVFLWDAVAGTLKARLPGHQDWVSGADFSPDGRILYTGDRHGKTIYCWEVATGKLLKTLSCDFRVDEVVIVPGGSSLAVSGAYGHVMLFDLGEDGTPAGNPKLVSVGHWAPNMTALPDGRLLAAGWRQNQPTISLAGRNEAGDWVKLAEIPEAYPEQRSLEHFAVHPSGSRFATSNIDGVVKFWKVGSDHTLEQDHEISLNTPSGRIRELVYSPDGTRLATAGPGGVTLWDSATGEKLVELSEHDAARTVDFSPDGNHIVSGGSDALIRMWRIDRGAVLEHLEGLDGSADTSGGGWNLGPWGLAFVNEGRSLLIGGGLPDAPTSVGTWDLDLKSWGERITTNFEGTPIRQVKVSPDQRFIAIAADDRGASGGFQVWDREQSRLVGSVDSLPCTNLAFHPTEPLLAATHRDGSIRVWQVDETEGCRPLGDPTPGQPLIVRDVEFTPDGKQLVAAGALGPCVYAFDAESGQLSETMQYDHPSNLGIAVNSKGTLMTSLSTSSRDMKIWDLATGRQIGATFAAWDFWPLRATFSPDGRLLAVCGTAGHLVLLDVADPASPVVLADLQHGQVRREAVFSPDGSTLVASSLNSVSLYDISRLTEAGDLTVYLDALRFTDTGVEWYSRNHSLRSARNVLPAQSNSMAYLHRVVGAGSPEEESTHLFDHYLSLNRYEAALAVVRARGGSGMTPEEEESFQRVIVADLRRALEAEAGSTSYDALQQTIDESGITIEYPADLTLRQALARGDWQAAFGQVEEAEAGAGSAENLALLNEVMEAVGQSLSGENEESREVPAGPLLLALQKQLTEDTINRWKPGVGLRAVPSGGDATLAVALRERFGRKAIVARGGPWQYWPQNSPAPEGWAKSGFDDQGWQEGPAPIGFGDGDLATTTVPQHAERITYYFRQIFQLAAEPETEQLEVTLQVDDGAVVYLNGDEILRFNLPDGPITDMTLAEETIETNVEPLYHSFSIPSANFRIGENILAVEVHQAEADSSDIRLDLGVWPELVVPQEAIEQSSALAERLLEVGYDTPWLKMAPDLTGKNLPANSDVPALLIQSRIEAVLGRTASQQNLLELAAEALENSEQPADWRRYRDVLSHLEALAQKRSDDNAAAALLEKILEAPRRPAGVPSHQLDLTSYYNSSLFDGRGWMRNGWKNISMQPVAGALAARKDGLGFDPRGIIQLNSGVYQDNFGEGTNLFSFVGESLGSQVDYPFPLRLDAIPVNRRCKAIHFLTGALHVRAADGTELGRIIVHYADESKDELPLRFNENMHSYWFGGTSEHLAWQGSLPGVQSTHALTHTIWQNPKPAMEVTSIDLVSSEAQGAPFVVAITVEE